MRIRTSMRWLPIDEMKLSDRIDSSVVDNVWKQIGFKHFSFANSLDGWRYIQDE